MSGQVPTPRKPKPGPIFAARGDAVSRLFEMATRSAAALRGLGTGAIQKARLVDFFTCNLDSQELRGWSPETLLDSFVFRTRTGS